MHRLIPVLFSNQAFRSLGNEPVKHPNEHYYRQRDDFEDIERISEDHSEQKKLEHLPLKLFPQELTRGISEQKSALTLDSTVLI